MAENRITPEEFGKWIPARDVYAAASNEFGDQAASHILKHLAKELLLARAEHMFITPDRNHRDYALAIVPLPVWKAVREWERISRIGLWSTNAIDVTTYESARTLHSSGTLWEMTGIRFNPEGVAAMMPPKYEVATPLAVAAVPRKPAVPETRKPVPPGLLEKWAKIFTGVHGTNFTGLEAQRSAEAMFLAYDVGRDRVAAALTAIVGKRTRGPKKHTDQDN